MKRLFLSIISLCAISVFAQDNKVIADPNATVRQLGGSFTAISVSSGIDLYITQGNEESIAVSANDQKYMERFKTVVESGTLKIYYDNKGITWNSHDKRDLKAYVSFKTLQKLNVSSGAEVIAKSSINADNLEIKCSSGSEFQGEINAKQVTVDQGSGSEMKVSGKVDKINIEVSSGAEFEGYGLTVDYCDASASSGGSVHISINKELNAKASSGGGIRYKGDGMIRDISISSGGEVKRAK